MISVGGAAILLTVASVITIGAAQGQACREAAAVQGPCRAAFPRWTFSQGSCRRFTYGGCRGNNNRFDSQAQCVASCGGSSSNFEGRGSGGNLGSSGSVGSGGNLG